MRAVAQADAGGRAADLLDGDDVREVAEARPAIGLGHRDAVQPEVAELRPQVAREGVVGVDPRRARGDLGGGEGGDAVAQHVDGVAVIEAEGGHHGRGCSATRGGKGRGFRGQAADAAKPRRRTGSEPVGSAPPAALAGVGARHARSPDCAWPEDL